MNKLTVHLSERSYPIFFEHAHPERLKSLLRKFFPGAVYFVITNTTVRRLYQKKLRSVFPDSRFIAIPDGEKYKTLGTAETVLTQLIRFGADRNSVIVAVGGGVVGDLAGFVAAVYMRGVPYVQVPTTLLAMVDSSVGGKVAVNHPLGKNLVGAFYQPKFVFMDTDFLRTLPQRERVGGLAEAVKYGLILDKFFFTWLEKNLRKIVALEETSVRKTVVRSCLLKARVVERDEKESHRRMILNFGHTWAHALERVSGYGLLTHGETVLLGMVAAGHLSCGLKKMPNAEFERLTRMIAALSTDALRRKEVRRFFRSLDWKTLWAAMQSDKKRRNKRLHWIVLDKIGKARIVDRVSPSVAEKSFDHLRAWVLYGSTY